MALCLLPEGDANRRPFAPTRPSIVTQIDRCVSHAAVQDLIARAKHPPHTAHHGEYRACAEAVARTVLAEAIAQLHERGLAMGPGTPVDVAIGVLEALYVDVTGQPAPLRPPVGATTWAAWWRSREWGILLGAAVAIAAGLVASLVWGAS